MIRLANVRIGVRLAAMTAISLVVLAAVLVIGLAGSRGQQRAARLLQDQQSTTRAAMQVKFRAADFNGWQTAYAFDAVRGAPGATDDATGSRAAFLAAVQSFRGELAAVDALPLDADSKRAVAGIERRFAQFMDLDRQIIGAYRTGRPDRAAFATGLVMRQEIDIFNAMAADVDTLVGGLDRAAAAAGANAQAAATRAERLMLVGVLLGVLLGAALAWLISRSITRPLSALRRRLTDIADGDGDVTQRLPARSSDELGQVAAAFNRFVERVQRLLAQVATTGERVQLAAGELQGVSGRLHQSAGSTDDRAGAAAAAAEQISRSVETVSSGAEQMGASIAEIAGSASHAARVARDAVGMARDADLKMSQLAQSSAEIDTVLRLISAVAGQTNLLALNATIEAARAGAAGRGFAVVAAEVKQLAQESARAAEDISARVAAIQTDTRAAISAIGGVATVIDQIDAYATTIAAATEEQTATTAEMSRSITEAATGSSEVAASVSGVAQAARAASQGADSATETAAELSTAAADLRRLLGTFRY